MSRGLPIQRKQRVPHCVIDVSELSEFGDSGGDAGGDCSFMITGDDGNAVDVCRPDVVMADGRRSTTRGDDADDAETGGLLDGINGGNGDDGTDTDDGTAVLVTAASHGSMTVVAS